MRKDLAGIYQMMSKVKNLSQDRKEFMSSNLPTIQDLTFTDDPLGGYTIPTPIHDEPIPVDDKQTKKQEAPKIKTKEEIDAEDRKAAAEKDFDNKSIDELLDMPDRFL